MKNTKWLVLLAFFALSACEGVNFGGSGGGNPSCLKPTDTIKLCYMDGTELKGLCIVSKLVETLKVLLQDAARNMFNGIGGSLLVKVVPYVLTLYVIVYGVVFLMGLIQVSSWDIFVRIFKIAIIAAVFSATGWAFFERTAGAFFRDVTDEIIRETSIVMIDQFKLRIGSVQVGGVDYLDSTKQGLLNYSRTTLTGSNPMVPIDLMLGEVVNPKTIAIMQAALTQGQVGWGFAYIAVYAVGIVFLLLAIAQAVWVYLMSLIATALLFGLFPLFILFILFQRTRGLFDGYIGILVSFMLQPIMLFMFITLFAAMVGVVLKDTSKGLSVCYQCGPVGQSSSASECGWRFAHEDANKQIIGCAIGTTGPVGDGTPAIDAACKELANNISKIFPNLLIFCLLAYICYHFSTFVASVSNSIASGFSLNSVQGFMHGLISQGGVLAQQGLANKLMGK